MIARGAKCPRCNSHIHIAQSTISTLSTTSLNHTRTSHQRAALSDATLTRSHTPHVIRTQHTHGALRLTVSAVRPPLGRPPHAHPISRSRSPSLLGRTGHTEPHVTPTPHLAIRPICPLKPPRSADSPTGDISQGAPQGFAISPDTSVRTSPLSHRSARTHTSPQALVFVSGTSQRMRPNSIMIEWPSATRASLERRRPLPVASARHATYWMYGGYANGGGGPKPGGIPG